MKLLIQRVKEASVQVNNTTCGKIGKGLLLFIGIHKEDTPDKIAWMIRKLLSLKVFPDAEGKMGLDVTEVKGEILVVSQFTLYGDCTQGKRPDFGNAALPEPAFLLYETFVSELSQALNQPIQTGVFGALMEVSLINDGPVTFLIEK